MARIRLLSTIGIICVLGLALSINNCHGQTQKPFMLNPEARDAVIRISDGLKPFSLSFLLNTIRKLPNQNVVVGPFSIWAMLTVLSEGTAGRTLQQLNKRLRIPRNKTILRTGFKEIARAFLINTTTIELATSNSIFVDRSAELKESYRREVEDNFLTEITNVNFKDRNTMNTINKRISDVTRGKIKSIVDENDLKDAVILVTNAIFFKGQWTMPFNRSQTERQQFFDSHNNPIGEVNMMHLKGSVPYANIRKLQAYAIKLQYGQENRLAMYVILPYYNISISDMIFKFEKVNSNDIYSAIAESAEYYSDEDVDVYLPRFSISLDMVLNNLLNELGIYDLFDPIDCNLSRMTDNRELYLSKAIHKATIDVNEEGTEASAVTAGTLSNRNTPPKFLANKPFMFMIVEETTNILVFGGVYSLPKVV